MDALTEIQNAGFRVKLDDDNGFTVSPSDKLTAKQREFLKQNKPQNYARITFNDCLQPLWRTNANKGA
jgi:hypothetical protein